MNNEKIKISDEDAQWFVQHKQSIESRNKVMKRIGVFALIFALVFISFVAMGIDFLFMIYPAKITCTKVNSEYHQSGPQLNKL